MFLKEVTLVCVDSINGFAALRAMNYSLDQCQFTKAIIFTDEASQLLLAKAIAANRHVITVEIIPKITSKEGYSRFLLKELLPYIDTEFLLVMQWDGFILNGNRFQSVFYEYDYIGAKWDFHQDNLTVGNGGFSWRSRRLLEALQQPQFEVIHPEDDAICRSYRRQLEQEFDLVFADEATADRFSFEDSLPPVITAPFGFHGAFNLHLALPEGERLLLLQEVSDAAITSSEVFKLLINLVTIGDAESARLLWRRIKTSCSDTMLQERLEHFIVSPSISSAFIVKLQL